MGIFGFACGRCWDRDCKCTPAEMEVYYKQAEINRNTPIKRETPTLNELRKRLYEANTKTADELAEQIKYSGLARDWNAEPIPNPDYKPAPNDKDKDDYLRRMLVVPVYKDWDNDASKGRARKKLDFSEEYCGHPDEPPQPGPIILVSTSGDDYEVLNKVDPRIKELALAGKLTLSEVGNIGVRLPLREEDGSPRYCQLAKNETFRPIKEADEDTLEAALGPCEETLTPENKYWILKSLLFTPVGKHKWSHPVLGDETIWFDIETDHLILLISRVFKEGYKDYKNSLKEWAVQQKRAT